MYSGKLKLRDAPCGCVWECFLYYFFGGYDKESFNKFIICDSCAKEEKSLTAEELEANKEKFWNMWAEETSEPGTTDDEWYTA